MKPTLLVIAITCLFLSSTNYSTALSTFSSEILIVDQNTDEDQQSEKQKEKIKNNKKLNQKAVDLLDSIIKNLEKEKLEDKAKALNAMRDHIKNNMEDDPATVLDEAADKGKETTNLKENKKKLKEYVDTIHSETAKYIFELNIVARGTGRTTGHIATLNISNPSDQFISFEPQLCYVPSILKYQGYIIFIPYSINVGQGDAIVVPIHGYCANPKVPPVPDGGEFPPLNEWIPINKLPTGGFGLDGNPPMIPEPMNPPSGNTGPTQQTTTVFVSDHETVPTFDPSMIATIVDSPGFSSTDEEEESDPDIIGFWPGTEDEIGGTVDPAKDPVVFGQVAAEAITRIIEVTDAIQISGKFPTPFSHDKEKEKEAIVQQAFWIFIAILLGDEYDEEDFKENIYTQYEAATGQDIKEGPPEQKAQVDNGAEQFWAVYAAVGVEAKVFDAGPENAPVSTPKKE